MKTTLKNNTEIPSTILDENDAEAPVWNVGHSWTYDVYIFGGIPNYVTFNNIRRKKKKSFKISCIDPEIEKYYTYYKTYYS